MSDNRFPFRFYGREPADWSPADPDFVYELQFERALSTEQRDKLVARAASRLAEGPASLGANGWWFSPGGRFALLCVGERYTDAPRMVFDRVAQLLMELHGVARIRDVVFAQAWGARSAGWDAWSSAKQAEPDAGPPRPEGALAQRLRRAVDPSHAPYVPHGAAPAVVTPPAPVAKAAPAMVTWEVVDPYAYPSPQPEDLSAFLPFTPSPDARWDEVIAHTQPPLARVHQGAEVVALAHLDAELARIETCFPQGAPPTGPAATDVDGVRAVVASGNAIWDLHLGEQKPQWRMGIHLNNGTVRGVAWTCDNLWAVLADQQLMVDDLSGPSPVYVGAVRVWGGTSLRSARHGTVLVARTGTANVLVGVCDWQLKILATLHGPEQFSHECGGELIFRRDGDHLRAAGLVEAYEAWAAPLRRRAEGDRKRRFANGKARRPPKRPHWTHVDAPPRWQHQGRRDAVRASLPRGEDWLSVGHRGDIVTVRSREGAHWSRGASLGYVDAEGGARPLGDAVAFASTHGVTNLSLSPDGRYLWVVDGNAFNIHRGDTAEQTDQDLGANPFVRAGGLLVDVIATGPDDLVALWVDALVWLRRKGSVLVEVTRLKMKWARGFAYDPAHQRFIITSQDKHRMLVVRAADEVFTVEARFTDGVKEAMFRGSDVYAEMTDGVFFALRGLA